MSRPYCVAYGILCHWMIVGIWYPWNFTFLYRWEYVDTDMAQCMILLGVFTSVWINYVIGESGTTPHLAEIFNGRCWDYKLVKYDALAIPNEADCKDLWNAFFEGFSFKPPCSLSVQNYLDFMQQAQQQLPENKAMFWSGTYVIAHEYAQDSHRYVTLEDTLIGYLANSLVWCGSTKDPSGVNTSRCPAWTDCPLESSESFWAAASTMFAQSVRGVVTLLLDGSREEKPAYSRESFFAKYELPNLSVKDVTNIIVIVTHNLGGPFKEMCNNGSLVTMAEDINDRGIKYECVDDPPAILHLLCSEDPKARECRLAHSHTSPATEVRRRHTYRYNYKPDRFNY